MKKTLTVIGLLAFTVGSYLSTFLFSGPNRYERAQHATVLLESTHGFGSGTVVRRDNKLFIWTAAHVVAYENTVKVRQVIRYANHKVGETTFHATVIARSDVCDLALLVLDAPPSYFKFVHFAPPDFQPRVGTSVYHVGNFLGPDFDGSVSTGVISQVDAHPVRKLWPWITTDQMTSLVMPGSSGGAVFAGNAAIGIVVGHVGPGFEFFVPLRTIAQFALENHVRFAFDLTYCPTDAQIAAHAKAAEYTGPVVGFNLP